MTITRIAWAAAVVVLAGCATPPPALGTRTAEISVGGDGVTTTQPIHCSQTGWMWIIESFGTETGFTATVQTGVEPEADSVQLRDLGGFTGTYWSGTTGNGEVSVDQGVFTVTGEAEGHFAEDPTERVTVPYRVTASC